MFKWVSSPWTWTCVSGHLGCVCWQHVHPLSKPKTLERIQIDLCDKLKGSVCNQHPVVQSWAFKPVCAGYLSLCCATKHTLTCGDPGHGGKITTELLVTVSWWKAWFALQCSCLMKIKVTRLKELRRCCLPLLSRWYPLHGAVVLLLLCLCVC